VTWGRMDDKFHRNKKVRALRKSPAGRLALGTWLFWWSWCLDDPELDGFVPTDELDSADLKSAELLCANGLWDRVDGGFRYHDFHDYNPTKKQRLHKLESDRLRAAEKRSLQQEVARDSSATRPRLAKESPPRARVGMGMGTYEREIEERDTLSGSRSEPADSDHQARADRALADLRRVGGTR
jgi:hypothetical protein